MTADDSVRFVQSFNRLAVALRLPADQADDAMQRIYWDALADFPIDVIDGAATSLAKSAVWFPKTSEWRDVASQQRLAQVLTLPAGREEPWACECEACEDTGWEQRRCYPGTGVNCGRKTCVDGGDGVPDHGFAYRCSCRATNSTFQRHHSVPKGRERYDS